MLVKQLHSVWMVPKTTTTFRDLLERLEDSALTVFSQQSIWCFFASKVKPIGNSAPKDFIGGCSHRNPEPRTHRNSKLLGRNLMFTKHNAVCTNSLDTTGYLSFMESLIWVWDPVYQSSSLSPANGHPCKQTFLRILYSFSRAAITKYHRLGGLNNKNTFFHSSEG